MNPNQFIHETVIRDILDIYDAIKNDDFVSLKPKNKLSNMKSIASASSGLTMTFPVLASRALSIEASSMVAKAQERKCTSMMQMLFSAIQVTDAGDAFKYLSNFHTNLSTRFFNVDDVLDITTRADAALGESTNINSKINRIKEEANIKELENLVIDDNKRNTGYILPDNISEHGINEYSVRNGLYGRSIMLEAPKPGFNQDYYDAEEIRAANKEARDYEDRMMNNQIKINKELRDQERHMWDYEDRNKNSIYSYNKDLRDRERHQWSAEDRIINNRLSKNKDRREEERLQMDKQDRLDRKALNKSSIAKNRADINRAKLQGFETLYNFNRNQLMDSDVKKANELMPTMLNVAYKIKSDDGELQSIDNVVCGIKCKLYAVESDDVMDHIRTKTSEKNVILGLVRATTREISFWKDLIFAIDKAKIDALSYSRKNSNAKLWKVLERRALKSRIRRTIGNGNDASAISTLAISQNEVEYLRKEYSIDLENVLVARNLMESYNLMSIVIVDEDLELCKFIYDTGDDLWETISFNHLERENSDNSYKRIVNMMTKMR